VILRRRINKTWVILGIAVLIGGLAALGAKTFLSSEIDAINARGKGATAAVLVAKHALKRGDRITTDTVAVRQIPVAYAQSSALTPEAFDRVDGQALGFPVGAGEMILWSLMEGKRVPTFSARVEVGHRAMTVAVDEINSISGMLEPGDRIDLLVTVDRQGKKIIRPLLQNVQVMATGQRAVDSPREGERRQYSTVTIDITPAQAHQVILARESAKVTALLRNPEDRNRLQGGNANMVALLGAPDSIRPDNGIPVLYGGSIAPESLQMGRRPGRVDVAEEIADAPRQAAVSAALRPAGPPRSAIPLFPPQPNAAPQPSAAPLLR
jgi:pilus assembly protein CpaB